MGEQFKWSKFFGGIVDPTAYFKTLASIVRIGIVILVVFCLALAFTKAKQLFFPKAKQPAIFTVTGQQGGCVKNSSDQKEQKFGILNF